MKEIVDNDVLWGGPIVTQQRTKMHVESRLWLDTENLILWPVLVPCQSQRDYQDTCTNVMRELKRKTQTTDWTEPAKAESNIERRMITEHIDVGDYPDSVAELMGDARMLLIPSRTGLQLSWAEQYQLIPGYWGKHHNRERRHERIPLNDFLLLLGRSQDDEWLVQRCMDSLDEHGRSLDPGNNRVNFRSAEFWHLFHECVKYKKPNVWHQLQVLARDGAFHEHTVVVEPS